MTHELKSFIALWKLSMHTSCQHMDSFLTILDEEEYSLVRCLFSKLPEIIERKKDVYAQLEIQQSQMSQSMKGIENHYGLKFLDFTDDCPTIPEIKHPLKDLEDDKIFFYTVYTSKVQEFLKRCRRNMQILKQLQNILSQMIHTLECEPSYNREGKPPSAPKGYLEIRV